jgi:hypothetical protein
VNFYKRYITKNGKKLGPYYYSSKKVDGKVISTYLGMQPPNKFRQLNLSKRTLTVSAIILSAIIVVLLVNLIFHLELFSTGNIPMSTPDEMAIPEEFPIITTPSITTPNITNKTNQTDVASEIPFTEPPVIDTPPANLPTINTIQDQAVINQPVKWTKEIQLENPGKTNVQLPKEAENIVVYKIQGNDKIKIDEQQLTITAKASSEIEITSEKKDAIPILSLLKKIINFLTGKAITIQEGQEVKEVVINENSKNYIIEYETSGPTTTEQESSKGKTIKLSSSGNMNYQDVLVSTNIPENLNAKNPGSIKIFWTDQEIYIEPETIEDKDNNGIYDYIEFIAPSSNNQTFEIIVITKAEHLDSNREFISDIYEQVKELDDIWSEEIPNQDYVRVTFEKSLTSENDITIYPRIINGNPRIEVYEKDGTSLIAEFTNLINEEYSTIYLTNLQKEQDTFDLKIVGGSLEFDHIIDPIALPGGTPNLRAQVCSGEDNAVQGSFGMACSSNGYPGTCGSAGDRVSCNDNIRETHTSTSTSNWGGIRIQSYNSSVTDCQNINQVFVCYEWWASATSIMLCDMSVDANGGTSYMTFNVICPGITANPGVNCMNVTAYETWSCSNFFGPSGTRALIKSEFRKNGGGTSSRTVNWDALYFNVTYSRPNQLPTINSVGPIPSLPPLEGTIRPVIFNASVSDPDGYTDITSVSAQFSMAGEPNRPGSCVLQSGAGNTATYSCTVNMQYYDKDGSWNVSVTATDSQSQQATNNTQTFNYQLLKAIVIISPIGSLNWPTLSQGQTNIFSNNDPTIINNTGNYNGSILITAFDLLGQTNPTQTILASNFRAGSTNGAECGATLLSHNSQVLITGSNLPRGSSATTSIYYCLSSVPSISSQVYSASGANSWIIAV